MARNGTGIFAVINPILVGALRSSSAVNQNFTDMGTQITNSLPVSGVAGMTGQFKAANGSQPAPGITFKNGRRVGFRRRAANVMAWVANGSDAFYIDADGKLWALRNVDVASNLIVDGTVTEGGRIGEIEALDGTGALVQGDEDALTLQGFSSTIPVHFVGQSTLIAGMQADIRIPFDCTITGVALAADAAGDAVVDIWKVALASYPPTDANGIASTSKPTLDGAAGYVDTTLTGWTTAITAGDCLRFNIDSIDGIARLSVLLQVRRYVA